MSKQLPRQDDAQDLHKASTAYLGPIPLAEKVLSLGHTRVLTYLYKGPSTPIPGP